MPITDTLFTKQNKALKEQELAALMKSVKEKESVINKRLAVVILAAGLGKRMKNPDKPKVMFELCGKPMVQYVLELASKLNPDKIIPVVGYKRELVIDFLKTKSIKYTAFAVQSEQLGTGHAVMQTEELLKDFDGEVLILSGDVPLLKYETLLRLISEHYDNRNYATLLTAEFKNPAGYGRIVRDNSGNFLKIVEDKDATEEEKKIREINPAIYVVNSEKLFDALKKLIPDNIQNEYYLTDIFHHIPKEKIGTVVTKDELEVTGINSIEQLREIETILNC